MKTIRYFIVILFMFIGGSTFAQQISKAELQVNGLTCSMCSRATETSLKSLGFIEDVTPDLNRNVFVLTFKSGQKVDLDQIRDKVQDAGFSIGDLSATINFKNTAVDDAGLAQLDGSVFQFINAKSKTLDGPVIARIMDKDFITSSAFKKKAAELKSDTYLKGKGLVEGKETRIFHLSI
ncbi:copper chaperone CopZ [Pedobacter cryoconitis]|uniref:heavy-metal-associated domain-containing protein n=1 Tax=Pedobacter cryoconitis TaxID=188932 RepID=UPI00160D71BC|nr:cation transporter [Pedobacter cryoconitis]MBB6273671.1 copper chaperone CopZ [Pedobacter cryoconitis]